jgi:hypothetical protein
MHEQVQAKDKHICINMHSLNKTKAKTTFIYQNKNLNRNFNTLKT